MYRLKVKVEVGLKFENTFLTQHLGFSIFDPALFRVYRWSPGFFQVRHVPGSKFLSQNVVLTQSLTQPITFP